MTDDATYGRLRSVLESPVLDRRKWAKVPSIPSDVVLCDMEDAVSWSRKIEGRQAVVAALGDRASVGGRLLWARPNALDTEWGHDDVVALAKAGPNAVMLPKVTSEVDVAAYRQILNDHGADPDLLPIIEAPGAVDRIEHIVRHERVRAVIVGEGDLTAALGIELFPLDGSLNPLLAPVRARIYIAAAAVGLPVFETAFLPNLRDMAAYRARAMEFAAMGVSGMVAIYPPQVDVINEVFAPSTDDVARAREIAETYVGVVDGGSAAVQTKTGGTILIHDYLKAVRTLERAGLPVPRA